MPDARLVVIRRCHDCTKCGYSHMEQRYRCFVRTSKTGRSRILRDIETIPACCPLPKAEETPEAKKEGAK